MKNTVVVLILSIVSCGQGPGAETPVVSPTPPSASEIRFNDNELLILANEFKQLCVEKNNQRCLNNWKKLISVEYVSYQVLNPPNEDSAPRAGICFIWNYNNSDRIYKSKIQILDRYKGTGLAAKAVLFHELGHCVLGLEHMDAPASSPKLMNSWIYHTSVYIIHWNRLVKELFESSLQLLSGSSDDDVVDNDVVNY